MSEYGSVPTSEAANTTTDGPGKKWRPIYFVAAAVVLIVITVLYKSGGESPPEVPTYSDDPAVWQQACVVGFQKAEFDFLATERYNEWYTEDSVMQLAQSGTFKGPGEMIEYVDFTKAKFFDYYKSLDSYPQFMKATRDECVLFIVNINKAQVNPTYGQPVCLETTVGFKLHYTVSDPEGNGFNIHRTNLYYSAPFLVELFSNGITGDGVRDFICEGVLHKNCGDVWDYNGLDEESCKERYDALPGVNEGGYLDDKAKGCRILHSAFAEVNKKHCPHMSFKPKKDYAGNYWCQESGYVVAEDLFTGPELAKIQNISVEVGYPADTQYKHCEYVAM
mmetsp:Transcript_12997/g.15253  ORF Transcript_12997/g.15253 Transcript_12997/m.15253 type:complete len:335 (-) Transcript_12997:118-1122(-)